MSILLEVIAFNVEPYVLSVNIKTLTVSNTNFTKEINSWPVHALNVKLTLIQKMINRVNATMASDWKAKLVSLLVVKMANFKMV